MHSVTLTMASYIGKNCYTYKPYVFKYNLPTIYEQNQKLNTLIHDEIRKLSWEKLLDWQKSESFRTGYAIHLMPQEYLDNIGQIATDNLLSKCKTIDDINTLYEYEETQKKIKDANSCNFCGESLEKSSIFCDRHKFAKKN